VIFFVNMPIGLLGLYLVYRHLPDYREGTFPSARYRRADPVRLRHRAAVVCAGSVWRAHAERARHAGAAGDFRRAARGYGLRATRTEFPLLRLTLFRIRTFRASVSGSFFTRLGIGGIPFLFPLLYQVGLGFTPIQSGLLMMPQAVAAMSLEDDDAGILRRFGYRAC
jgi:hypothetical protein